MLFVWKHLFDILLLGLIDRGSFAEFTLSFTSFFCEDVAFSSLFTLVFTGTGLFEALFGPTVGFHLWHSKTPMNIS
ncbi:hypothetical protein SAMN06265218_10742 [Fodinibius sediminis]|uniref:Uncharacterized protein n=1 Tax=Fodinibius sediminis TaxID=1214077 RepID=A0A521CTT8_9BACT|nr:hypothetical protein SAMN06265218_10742 [Fodinibius sediminis]